MSSATADQGPESGVVGCRLVIPGEQPVLPADRDRLERPLRSVVVDVQEALCCEHVQGFPLVQGVGDRCRLLSDPAKAGNNKLKRDVYTNAFSTRSGPADLPNNTSELISFPG